MSEWWAIPMLISGGLFVGGVVMISWERVPAWREADLLEFRTAFAQTIRRVDRLLPALVIICLISTIAFATSAGSAPRILALLAAAGLLVVLVGSGSWLVPIQRRLVVPGWEQPSADTERLRTWWLGGHLIRTVVALAAFTLVVVAAVL